MDRQDLDPGTPGRAFLLQISAGVIEANRRQLFTVPLQAISPFSTKAEPAERTERKEIIMG